MGHISQSYATAQEMAAKYRLSDHTVRRKVQSGEWPCDRIGRLYRFSPDQQYDIAQIVAGTQRGGYDKDRIAAALRKLSS
jgi:excisionase family DNA binding protein